MSQAHAGAWWSEVEHLREAAETRIAERERAQRERRAPSLTPLGATSDRMAEPVAHTARFRRASTPSSISPAGAASARAAAAATSSALAHELAPVEETWGDLDDASPEPAPEPEATERSDRRAELRRLAREQAAAAADRTPRATTRRTIEIRGHVPAPTLSAVPDPVAAPASRRRPSRTPADRFAARPDRIAQWAFLLGLFLIVVALLSGN